MSSYILMKLSQSYFYFFFFNDTATTEIYTLSLHDALPISLDLRLLHRIGRLLPAPLEQGQDLLATRGDLRSEEHTSELQSRENLVCRLLLEKKKKNKKHEKTKHKFSLTKISSITHRRYIEL